MMKKLIIGLLSINLFANNVLIFEEMSLNGKKVLFQKTISQNLEEVMVLKNFEYETKVLIKVANNYAKNQKLFNSVEDHPVMRNINYLLVKIVKTNGFLWDKAISYQGKEYEVLYNFLDTLLSDKEVLLTSNEETLSDKLIQKDLLNKILKLQNNIIANNKHKLNKDDIKKIRAFYIVLSQIIQDYKETINKIKNILEVKNQMDKNKKLKQAFDEISQQIDLIQKNIKYNLIKLNKWDSIKIF